jgi:alpha-tubulin suppressor-like RCC1 family protein
VNINNDNVVGMVVSISCGFKHSCALLNDGTVKCWGNNSDGQCNVPDFIQGKVVSIECGKNHSCALLNDNTIRCWGTNSYGACDVPDSIQGEKIENNFI